MDLNKFDEPFSPEDIEWRIQQSGKTRDGKVWAMVLAYVTNRAIMKRLDDVCGKAGWRNEYRDIPNNGGVECGISIKIDSEWVTKWDAAENTQVEAVKGGRSGAMKRAAVQWGIGRYDWSDANVWGYSNGWARHEIKKETLSITGFHAVRRILKAVQASRKDNYKAKRQIQRTLKRQDINRSPITPFQAPLISKHDWDLSVLAATKEAETERRELLSSQIINSNKVQTHPLLRMLRKARVRASRARRESGGYDHYY
ncbi:TPA: Rad52/Rad22 family DNA repair protein [Escherichia coli]|nr:Rad52/Rad22 family DNA repair protein [Escherichia coli]EFN5042017.1 recombinase [Escherichia coli]CAK0728692.1 hypothetical protein FGAF829_13230 [Escherichia coli]